MHLESFDDCHGVYTDAYLYDESRLLFLSVFGRDTAIQEFLARLSLKPGEGGFEHLSIGGRRNPLPTGESVTVKARLPKGNLFGELRHVFIFDKTVQAPDRGLSRGYVLNHASTPETIREDRLWTLAKLLCPVPLLDTWRANWLHESWRQGWIRNVNGIGAVSAFAVDFGSEHVTDSAGALVRAGHLALPVTV